MRRSHGVSAVIEELAKNLKQICTCVDILKQVEQVLNECLSEALTKKSKQRMPKLPIIHGSDVITKVASIDLMKIWRP